MNSIAEIDLAIRISGFPEGDIVRAAGFEGRYLYKIRSGQRPLTPRTINRVRVALDVLKKDKAKEERQRQIVVRFPERNIAVRCYKLAIAMVAQFAGVQPSFILSADPAKRATADPKWMRAARLRRLAIYIVITYLDISQSELGRAVGVSKATICNLLKELGEERDQPEIEAALAYVEEAFAG